MCKVFCGLVCIAHIDFIHLWIKLVGQNSIQPASKGQRDNLYCASQVPSAQNTVYALTGCGPASYPACFLWYLLLGRCSELQT